ncbi:hypothetical protein GCM10007852_24390 [Agaribacter marinus]|uniref:Inner membrane component domain-containing protein n=1 Tax=Agaribacter marinus TaxID=1431249 RepID=A0AA37T0Q6_9ALTE|nr:hypothetical protein GCM10007852_24390 [Agaribacter marinus]
MFLGIIMFITIIGIPWGRAAFNFGLLMLWPFGRVAVSRAAYNGEGDLGTGTLGLIGNIIWMIFGGIWLAIGHLIAALVCAITIIGIPFALQHLKFAMMAPMPIGKVIISKEEARSRGLA